MIDEDRRNDLLEEQYFRQSRGDTIAIPSVDPRIISIARALGRLIAQERFEELTDPKRSKDR